MNQKQLKNETIPVRRINAFAVMMFFCFSIFSTGQLYSKEFGIQQNKREVKGTVIDLKGDPLPGTTIIIQGATTGVITDGDGAFKIEVADNDVLVVSFIGMESQYIPVSGKTSITIVLQEATSELDEVTVVAFATQKKESVISSISTVRPSELKTPTSNLTEIMPIM